MVADEKEKTSDTGDEGMDTEESWAETMTIEETREQLAAMYLNLLDQQKWGLVGTFAKVKAMIGNQDEEVKNPIKKQAIQYMIGESETVEAKQKLFDKIRENIKKNASEKIGWSLRKDAEGNSLIGYDKAKLAKMKAMIEANKDNQTELENLMLQIQQGIDPTLTDTDVDVDDNADDLVDNAADDADVSDKVIRYASEYKNVEDIPVGKNVNAYLSLLTGWVIDRTKAQPIVEKQLVKQEFMGMKLNVNKYMAEALKQVEKDIKASDDEDLKKYVFTNMSTYNRRNVRGSNSLSYHALWLAIDIDPANNPMVQSKRPKIVTNMPPELIRIFNKNGFIRWGNRGNNDRKEGSSFRSDAMHFEFKDIDYLTAAVKDTDADDQRQAA